MAYCCPKSVRACALRVTRLNSSGVPVDPTQPDSRVMTSGFIEVGLSPQYESGRSEVTRDLANNVLVVDTDFDVLLGFEVELKLCAVNPVVLEMMTGAALPSAAATVLNDTKTDACLDPVMVEVWSKNVAQACLPGGEPNPDSGQWVHWVLPRTSLWRLAGDLTFSAGAVEVSLSGFATSNEGWFPSYPDPDLGYPSWTDGWPIGPAPVVLPEDVVPDAWTEAEADAVRTGGPLAWRCVPELPGPLSDCDYAPNEVPCVSEYVYSLVGYLPVDSPPWNIPPIFVAP